MPPNLPNINAYPLSLSPPFFGRKNDEEGVRRREDEPCFHTLVGFSTGDNRGDGAPGDGGGGQDGVEGQVGYFKGG